MPYFRDCITKMVETSRGRTLLKSSSDAEVTTSEVIFFFKIEKKFFLQPLIPSFLKVHQALTPLTTYLTSNLSLLNGRLYKYSCAKVTTETWKAVLKCFKVFFFSFLSYSFNNFQFLINYLNRFVLFQQLKKTFRSLLDILEKEKKLFPIVN